MLIDMARLALKIAPNGLGYIITDRLAAMTQRPQPAPDELRAMADAERLDYGADGRMAAFEWGEGPTVVLVHGWSGRAAQMAPLAKRIASAGFRTVAFDVEGHGDSPGNQIHWRYFLRDIPALADSLGVAPFAFVGHSAGALTMMAARHAGRIRAERYVCICAPSHPFPPINVIKKKLSPRPAIIERYKTFIANQFGATWHELESGREYLGLGSDTLLFYDTTDRFVTHSEGDKIAAIAEGARLIKTDRYSHTGILTSPELCDAVVEFLTASD